MAPEQVDKLINFGQMALEQGWYDQAREDFEKVLALDPSNQEAIDGLARIDEILKRKASFEPAKPEIPVAKPAQPEKPEIEKLLDTAQENLEAGHYELARGYLEQVLKLDPTNQEAKKELKGLVRIEETLSRQTATTAKLEMKPAKSKEYANRIAERKRLAAEEKEKRTKEIAKREDEMLASGMAATAEPIQDEPEEKRGLPRLMQIGLILEMIGTSLTLIGLLLFLLLFFMCLFPSCFKWL